MNFDDLNLNTPLRNALEELGYFNPTPIQSESFAPIMSGRDILGIAQTGTGKTFAFLLPLLRNLKFSKENHPRILILVPTRELVIQTVGEIEKLTKYINVRFGGVYGGTNMNTQKTIVENGIDILVATPGRLIDLALCRALRLKAVRHLVIDEFDEMLQLGFRTQLKTILDMLPERRQNLLFSATLSDDLTGIVDDHFYNTQKIEIVPHGTPLDQIDQSAYFIPNFYTKVNLLKILLEADQTMNKLLIFCKSKRMADRLSEEITPHFPEQIDVIHGNKSQNYRINVVKTFSENKLRILIATDIIARGLDISDVSHVINFDMPEDTDSYIHRIGRTGRADKPGKALSFIREQDVELQMALESLMAKTITMLDRPENLVISDKIIEEEREQMGGDKDYLQAGKLRRTQGAFHDKKLKNMKVNRAEEKRRARRTEKLKSKRKKKK